MIRTAKSNYYNDALLNAKGNCFKLWQLFKNVIGDYTTPIFTPLKVNEEKVYESFIAAKYFNKYFPTIAANVLKDIPHGASYVPSEGAN